MRALFWDVVKTRAPRNHILIAIKVKILTSDWQTIPTGEQVD